MMPEGEVFLAPRAFRDSDRTDDFESGESSLDEWLDKRAAANQEAGASRTFVTCVNDNRIVGYYCLSASSIQRVLATGAIRRNMPDPIPMLLLGRLAVDRRWQRRGIGRGLLKDAVLRTVEISQHVGVRGLLVHAVSEGAKRFYMDAQFEESPVNPMTLMVRLSDIAETMRS
jgi:predicted N-acetyltransferase YhbS